MKFSELINDLCTNSQPYMLIDPCIKMDCEISDVNMLAADQSDTKADTLYFADASQLTDDTELPTNLVYSGALTEVQLSKVANSAQVRSHEMGALFQCAKQLIDYQQSDLELYTRVLYMMCSGAPLDNVLTAMSDVTRNLYVIIDSTGKLLAKTKNFYVDYPLWMESIKQGYCSDTLIEYIEERRKKNNYSLSNKPFTLFCEHLRRYLLCTRIVCGDTMMGYVIMVSKTQVFNATEHQVIPLLSKKVKEWIVSQSSGRGDFSASQLNNILADIVSGTQSVDLIRRMKLSKLSFPEQKCLLMVRPVYFKEPDYYRNRLLPDMHGIFGDTVSAIIKNDLILLLPVLEGGTISTERRTALERYAQDERVMVGISSTFSDNNLIRTHYNLLLKLLELAKQKESSKRVFYFPDYKYYTLFDDMASKNLLSFSRHPALDMLIQYDRKKGSELYQTLRVFTKCGFNKAKTSEELFLHRNTVNYRISQIEQICGLDLSTTDELFALQFSFLVDAYLDNTFDI